MTHRKHERLLAGLLSIVMMFSLLVPPVSAAPAESSGTQYTYSKLPQSAVISSSATTEKKPPQYNDGPAGYAFDGNPGTGWHSDYGNKDLPESIEWTLDDTYSVGKIEYVKKSGGNNGIWKKVTVQGKTNGDWFNLATADNLPNDNSVITFAPQMVSALKVTVEDSHNSESGSKFASAGEIYTYQALSDDSIVYERIPQTTITGVTPSSEETSGENTPASKAFDNDLSTFWHSKWSNAPTPHTIQWSVGQAQKIGRIEYFKRPGKGNGDWKKVTVEGKNGDGQWIELAKNVVIPAGVASKKITFAEQMLTDLKVTIHEGAHNDASAAEIYTYQAVRAGSIAKRELRTTYEEISAMSTDGYTQASVEALNTALTEARTVLSNEQATDQQCQDAAAKLNQAVQGLAVDPSNIVSGAPAFEAETMTAGQPFGTGTGHSANFRIPSIITLKHQQTTDLNGRLVAAIDARWNHTGDACALDTILSVSDNNGATWDNYSFPNYFNDSTDLKASNATAFIDPLMVEGEDGTIYLMVDLYPGGVAINTAPRRPAGESGYRVIDNAKRMVLYTGVGNSQSTDNYSYYVGDFGAVENGKKFAPVLTKGEKTTAYYVDDHYYLYTAEKKPMYCRQIEGENLNGAKFVQQNVFFYNAELHVRDATYLWLITSKDGGASWSAPTILNPMVRKDANADIFYGVGPGAGLSFVDANQKNVILLQGYTFSNQFTSFVYSADNGATWHRAPNATGGGHWSSESALVQIDETTVRQFYRDGQNSLNYTDYTWNPDSNTFTTNCQPVSVPGASKTSNNQLSAIKYSQEYNGKPVYLVSTANGGGSSRSHGHMYVLTLEADKTMQVLKTLQIEGTASKYGYSSLTETEDGNIALLYEGPVHNPANGSYGEDIYFTTISKTDLFPQMTEENVELKVGETKTFPAAGQIVSNEPAGVVEATITTETVQKAVGLIGTNNNFDAGKQELNTALFTFDKQGNGNTYQISAMHNGQKIYMQLNTAGGTGGYPMAGTAVKAMDLVNAPDAAGSYYIKNAGTERYLYFMPNGDCVYDSFTNMNDGFKVGARFMLYRPAAEGETSSTEIPGFVKVTSLNQIQNGGQYLIVSSRENNLFVMRPATDAKAGKFNYVLKVATETTAQNLNLKGLTAGDARVVVGNTVYHVTVTENEPEVKPLPENKVYKDAYVSDPTATSEHQTDAYDGDGPARWAFDYSTSTAWHIAYGDRLPQSIQWTFGGEVKTIGQIGYVRRDNNGQNTGNGRWKTIEIYGQLESQSGDQWTLIRTYTIPEEAMAQDGQEVKIPFNPTPVKAMKITVTDSYNNGADKFAQAGEIRVYEVLDRVFTIKPDSATVTLNQNTTITPTVKDNTYATVEGCTFQWTAPENSGVEIVSQQDNGSVVVKGTDVGQTILTLNVTLASGTQLPAKEVSVIVNPASADVVAVADVSYGKQSYTNLHDAWANVKDGGKIELKKDVVFGQNNEPADTLVLEGKIVTLTGSKTITGKADGMTAQENTTIWVKPGAELKLSASVFGQNLTDASETKAVRVIYNQGTASISGSVVGVNATGNLTMTNKAVAVENEGALTLNFGRTRTVAGVQSTGVVTNANAVAIVNNGSLNTIQAMNLFGAVVGGLDFTAAEGTDIIGIAANGTGAVNLTCEPSERGSVQWHKGLMGGVNTAGPVKHSGRIIGVLDGEGVGATKLTADTTLYGIYRNDASEAAVTSGTNLVVEAYRQLDNTFVMDRGEVRNQVIGYAIPNVYSVYGIDTGAGVDASALHLTNGTAAIYRGIIENSDEFAAILVDGSCALTVQNEKSGTGDETYTRPKIWNRKGPALQLTAEATVAPVINGGEFAAIDLADQNNNLAVDIVVDEGCTVKGFVSGGLFNHNFAKTDDCNDPTLLARARGTTGPHTMNGVDLYRVVEKEIVMVTATFVNGSETVETRSLEEGAVLGELPTASAPEGQVFKGWQDPDGTLVTAETVISADTTYTAVFEPKVEPLFEVVSSNVVLGNSLAMKFAVNKDDLKGITNAHAVFTKINPDGTKEPLTVEQGSSGWDDNTSGPLYYIEYKQLSAKEMSCKLELVIYDSSNKALSKVYTTSIQDYAKKILTDPKFQDDLALKTTVVDMLNYGTAAQVHFGYDLDRPANAILTEDQQALATQNVTIENKMVRGQNYVTTSLSLDSNIVLNLYFKGITKEMEAEVFFVNADGTETFVGRYLGTEFGESQAYQAIGVPVDDLAIADGKKLVKCVVKNGEQVVAETIDSVESYAARVLAKSQNENLKNLMNELMKFVDSSSKYFKK